MELSSPAVLGSNHAEKASPVLTEKQLESSVSHVAIPFRNPVHLANTAPAHNWFQLQVRTPGTPRAFHCIWMGSDALTCVRTGNQDQAVQCAPCGSEWEPCCHELDSLCQGELECYSEQDRCVVTEYIWYQEEFLPGE